MHVYPCMSSATEQQVATRIHTAAGRHISGMIEFLLVSAGTPQRANPPATAKTAAYPKAMNRSCARQEMGFTRTFCSADCTLHCVERAPRPIPTETWVENPCPRVNNRCA